MAGSVQGRPQETVRQGDGVDENHPGLRGRPWRSSARFVQAPWAAGISSVDCKLILVRKQGAEIYGLNVDEGNNITYREWAPNATQAFLIGDFSKPPELPGVWPVR